MDRGCHDAVAAARARFEQWQQRREEWGQVWENEHAKLEHGARSDGDTHLVPPKGADAAVAQQQGSPLVCELCRDWGFPFDPSWSRYPMRVCDASVGSFRGQVAATDADSLQGLYGSTPWFHIPNVMGLRTQEAQMGGDVTQVIHSRIGFGH